VPRPNYSTNQGQLTNTQQLEDQKCIMNGKSVTKQRTK